jgi:NAD(P)-dependent dehydrogenase (short-subunit alcohol dehydrogenase family)
MVVGRIAMNSVEGKVVLITGAKGGRGSFVAEAFLGAGATVVGVSRSIQASDFGHPNFHAMPAELSSGDAARKVAEDVVAKMGRVDALVHVMGGFAGGKSVAETDDATLEKMLDLNYRAAFYIARAVLPFMRQQGSGRILAVASRQAAEPGAMLGRAARRRPRWWRSSEGTPSWPDGRIGRVETDDHTGVLCQDRNAWQSGEREPIQN